MTGAEELEAVKSLMLMFEKLAESPGAVAQRLAALTTHINWDKVHTFELEWKTIGCGDTTELVPVVKMEFIRE